MSNIKRVLVVIWLVLISCGIGVIFWYTDLVYHLPTPIPANYKPVNKGQFINLHLLGTGKNKPLFLHFFNPSCPCSRFNIPMFKSLYKRYGIEVNFAIVIMSSKGYTAEQIRSKFDLDIPVFFDSKLATACGVYSTPQVVLLDQDHRLYYRGNYNSSRYCTDEQTNYAKIAIEGLLHNNTHLVFNPLALRAYGCQLPNCKK